MICCRCLSRNAGLFAATILATSMCLGAEAYPARPVRVIAPYSPGSITDTISRVTSQQLFEQLGKPFIVDNRPGAGGVVGIEIVAKAIPDGYTLLMAGPSFAVLPGLNAALPYDALKDFTPISQISGDAEVLVVSPSLNVNTLKAFIVLVQGNPGKFNYGTGGVGTLGHLMSELFKKATRVDIVHIPYKGSSDVLAALFGGQVQMQLTTISTLLPQIRSDKVRALAVTTDGKRSPQLPGVPSMSEAGVPGMTGYSWSGLLGPAGLPRDVVHKLHTEVLTALRSPAMKERFANVELVGNSSEQFAAYIRSDLRRFAEIIKSAGIKPE